MGHSQSAVPGRTFYSRLVDATRVAPETIALLGPNSLPATYQDILQQVRKVARSLAYFGLHTGDKVATVVSDSPEMATLFLGTAFVASCAPLNPRYRSSDFEFYLSDLKPKLVVVDSDLDSSVRDVAKSLGITVLELSRTSGSKAGCFDLGTTDSSKEANLACDNDVALVLHTSGTTSRPKMVPISHANLIASVTNIARSLSLTPADRCLNIMPLFHVHGLIGTFLSSLYAGSSVVCTSGFQAPLFFEWLEEFRPTWYSGVPTMHRAILERTRENPYQVSRNSLRFIRSCSAALAPEMMKELEATFRVPVIEAYGMTEASHQMASNPLPPGVRKPGSVGIPAGVQIAIMNEAGEFLPTGTEGEVVIQGPNVVSGYEHNPEANEKSFINGWFRTGDQGRLDNDRYLFITGRIKELIVRGGEKISPREIDELLLTHPAVAQALAFAIPDDKLGEEIGAAVVLKRGQSIDELELREYVARHTADFKVPRKIVFVDKLPTGPTGKLQRIGLAAVLGLDKPIEAQRASQEFIAPRNDLERILADIWAEVLHRANPSVTEDFFAAGGDSILAAQFVGRIRRQLGIEVSIPRLFASPNIADLADWLRNQPANASHANITVPRADRSQSIPLSFPQRRMWFAAEYAGKSPVYNRGFALRLRGALDLFRIQQSLTEVVERHAILRTNYSVHDGVPVQKVEQVRPVAISLVDLSREEPARRMTAAAEWIRDEFQKPFNLSADLMLRAGLAKLDQNDHVLLFVSHHIAFDATSQPPFLRDLGAAYRGSLKPLEADAIDYPDFATWQVGNSGAADGAFQWWKRELATLADVHTFPGDFPRPMQQSYQGGTVVFSITEAIKDKVTALAKGLEATPFMVLLAAFHALAARYTGLDDSVVGTPIAGRTVPETEDMVGLFVNLLVLRTRVPLERSFRELVQRVRTATLSALEHQDLPFEKLVEGLSPERSLSHSPLFQVMFEYRNHAVGNLEIDGISTEPFEFESGTSQYDLHLDLSPRETEIHCVLRYNADLFKHESAERILNDYVMLLASALEEPDRPVAELPCSVTPDKRQSEPVARQDDVQLPSGIPHTRSSDQPCPLSFAQERLWFLHQLEPDNSTYNIPALFNMKGKLDREALRRSFEIVLQRHESLRTVFHAKDGAPVQIVQRVREFPLPVIDVASLSDSELDDLAREEILRPFDLTKATMLRATLYSRGSEDHSLLIVVHHIAADGWSMPILHQELGAAYSALVRGHTPQLPPLAIQYADFANWQRGFLTGKLLQDQLDFWTRQLKDAPGHPLLLTDRPRGVRQTYAGNRHIVPMSAELESELNEFNRKERVTLFMTLLAALQSLLHRMTGENDLVVGAPIANRTRMELEPLIGFFVNTLAFRGNFSGDPSFREVLNRVRETTIQAYQNQDLPFEKLVQALQPERSLSHTPIFQVIFALQNTPDECAEFGGLTVSPRDIDEHVAKFDLSIFVEFKPRPRIVYNANTDLFERDTVLRFARHFENLVRSAIKSPDIRISELDCMDAEERTQLLTWARRTRPYPQKAVHEIFEEVVTKSPEATAIVAGSKTYSYRELNDRSNQIAATLRQLDVGPGMRVGLLMRRSIDAIASMLATLKIGAAYVPLDKDYPAERIEFICEDCGTAAVLTSPDLVSHVPSRQTVIRLDEANGNRVATRSGPSVVTPGQEAYVMYTSGSTGQPKGVAITHRGIVRLVFSQEYATFGPSETTLQLAPLSFDASTLEIWAALLHGGKCVLYSGSRIDAEQLGNAIRTHGVSTLWLTASLFNSIIDESPEVLSPVRQLLAGGESLSVPHVRRAFLALKETQLINGYGPTENTTFSCCHRITGETLATRSTIPIGKPIANTDAYILDSRLRLVPIGVPGELYLGGDGLAIGYVNRPDLTYERFVSLNLPNGSTSRLYRSGDVCRWLNDGTIEFLGRRDEQVKIRGFRIELGEVETAIAGNPSVNSVAVVVTGDGANKRLAAYVVTKPKHELAGPKLRDYLRGKLPEYMIPAHYVFLAALPISKNGKIDKSVLPDPGGALARPVVAVPHDSIEAKLKSIWENVLGIAPIGIDQDFFELGGHSLLATKLLARVERTFGVKLPIASIFQYSTIAEFAPLVRNQLATAQHAPSAKPPLIWVGGGTFLRPITKWLQPDRNVISISLDPDEWASIDPPYRLQDIASTLAARILRDCPRGPYHLGGWCYEGILAYETAQRLQSKGEEVGLLVLVDAATPLSRAGFSSAGEVIARIQREIFHLHRMARMKPSGWLPYLRDRIQEFSQQVLRRKWQSSYRAGLQNQSAGDEESNRVLHLAMMEYIPKPYRGPVLFFQAAERPMGKYWDLAWEWKALAGDQCVCREIPGDHVTLLKTPNIDILADDLKSALDAAAAREPVTFQTMDVGHP